MKFNSIQIAGIFLMSTFAVFGTAPQDSPLVPDFREDSFLSVSDEKIGSRRTEVVREDDRLTITETVNLRNPFGEFGWKATVVYRTQPSLTPISGTCQTFADGEPILKGIVRIDEGKMFVSAVGKKQLDGLRRSFDKEESNFEKDDIVLAGKRFLFTTGLAVVAPLLATEDGTVEEVTLLEFPDDIGFPEVIQTKSNGSLKRKTTPQGKVEIVYLGRQGGLDRRVEYDDAARFLTEWQGRLRFVPKTLNVDKKTSLDIR